ncbi:hypothetical protein WMF20_19920 [Sorangium sp. So ce834]|uniref:hypothetical protein n=1 Tax=Sorangium sp. So ce834 TaxID=3133321 RepID=UPI003F6038F2
MTALAAFGCGARSSLDDAAPTPASGPAAGEGGAGGSGVGAGGSGVGAGGSGVGAGGSGVGAGVGGSAPVCEAGCLELAFARRFDRADVVGLAVDARGNILLTGTFDGTVDFGGGPLVSTGNMDAFVLKLDPLGNHLWSRRFGDVSAVPDLQAGIAIAADASGNILVGGHFGGTTDFGGGPVNAQGLNAFLVLLDASGQHVWSTHFGTGSATVRGVGFLPAGDIVVTGDYVGTVDLGGDTFTNDADAMNVFVARLDAAGGHVWSRSFGWDSAHVSALALDAAGNLVLGGSFHHLVDFGGGPLRAAGPSWAAEASDIFVASLGPDGEHRWSQRLGSVAGEHPGGTVVDGAGNVVSLGFFGETFQFGGDTLTSDGDAVFVAKLSATGAPTFARSFPRAHALAADAAGNTWLAGAFIEDTDFGCGPLTTRTQGLFVAGLDPRGDGFCSASFQPSEHGGLSRLALDPAGALIAVGNLKGTIDFGAGPISSPETEESMLVVKFIP